MFKYLNELKKTLEFTVLYYIVLWRKSPYEIQDELFVYIVLNSGGN